ncbi:hypothetical protein C7974DRAFT_397295 [Boeremia exigua]|uniref:uncharacterized protein n=1 Tax=Boeremia exigua TaxID=749465 RepID=UPI001E8CE03A|nr:uncharacterized protein C7974DRAFT_397295 [Boeremia exigua]KAH6621886.1 hypothetical protein C7974DRAFT_397295 [Boeremia exigua]
MVHTFRIVLRQEAGFDIHHTREFDLALDSKFAIGRASKNLSKGYLLPAKHNVYIDSPVVSREHAILTANSSTGTPQVFITDTKSMHGTYVNGTPLVPNAPKQLSSGDQLQFGVNVNRNESYFMAYRYTFNAELSHAEAFSRGFTVPEAESEEEEVECVHKRRGSQLNPLILDESDAELDPEHEDHDEDTERSDDNNDVTMVQDEEDEVTEVIELSEKDDSADGALDLEHTADEKAWSLFDIESDAASNGSASDYGSDSPLVDEPYVENVKVQVHSPAAPQTPPTQSAPVEQHQPSTVNVASLDLYEPERGLAYPSLAGFQHPVYPGLSLPPVSAVTEHYVPFSMPPFEGTVAPPLPPRPSQKRQRIWDEAPRAEPTWYGGAPPGTFAGDNIATHYSSHKVVSEAEPISASWSAADGIQTPSPTEHAEVVHQTSSPLARRTGVAITEIVDEQPPTPTSIKSRKRSAVDAFEEEAEQATEQKDVEAEADAEEAMPLQPTSNGTAPEEAVIPNIERVTVQQQRPIAQPRGIFKRALGVVKVMVPATAFGAVLTVTALTTLPESFFTVA